MDLALAQGSGEAAAPTVETTGSLILWEALCGRYDGQGAVDLFSADVGPVDLITPFREPARVAPANRMAGSKPLRALVR